MVEHLSKLGGVFCAEVLIEDRWKQYFDRIFSELILCLINANS